MLARMVFALWLGVAAILALGQSAIASSPSTNQAMREQSIGHGLWLPLGLVAALAVVTLPPLVSWSPKRRRG